MQIKKATRQQKKIRVCVAGPSGAGKTYLLLALATGLVGPEGKILGIDVEHGRMSFMADLFNFDVIELEQPTLDQYFEALKLGESYDAVCIDPLSHAWDAINEENQNYAERTKNTNSFQAWGKKGNPLYNKLIQTMMTHPAHILASMRVKSDYIMEEYTGLDGKTRTKPVKVGLQPKFREGGDYEFDISCNVTLEHRVFIEKSPPTLGWDEKVFDKPGKELGESIRKWLDGGAIVTKPIEIPRGQEYLKPLTTNGVQPAAEPVTYPGNPWAHIVEGDKNSQVGVPLCMIDDNMEWWKRAQNAKVPSKGFTAKDIAAVQKILAADNEFNQVSRQEAKDEYNEPVREFLES